MCIFGRLKILFVESHSSKELVYQLRPVPQRIFLIQEILKKLLPGNKDLKGCYLVNDLLRYHDSVTQHFFRMKKQQELTEEPRSDKKESPRSLVTLYAFFQHEKFQTALHSCHVFPNLKSSKRSSHYIFPIFPNKFQTFQTFQNIQPAQLGQHLANISWALAHFAPLNDADAETARWFQKLTLLLQRSEPAKRLGLWVFGGAF